MKFQNEYILIAKVNFNEKIISHKPYRIYNFGKDKIERFHLIGNFIKKSRLLLTAIHN